MSIRNYKIYFIGIFSSIILLNARNVVINIRSAKNLFLFKQFMKEMGVTCCQITVPKTLCMYFVRIGNRMLGDMQLLGLLCRG